MKKFCTTVLLYTFLISSCSKRSHTAVTNLPNNAPDKNLFVPFTKDLRDKIYNSKIDLKKVQFFVDQQLILKRTLGTEKAAVQSGIIIFEKGDYINEIILPAFTPGILETVNGDRLSISFEKQGNQIEFAALGDNNFFRLVGANWNNSEGSADILYDNTIYKVQCGSCSTAGAAKLVVIKKVIDNMQNNKRVLEGRRISE